MFANRIFDTESVALGLVTIVSTLKLTYPFYYFVERLFVSKHYKNLHRVATATPKKPGDNRVVL